MNIFGFVDTTTRQVYSLQIPGLLSFLAYHNFETPVVGLEELPSNDFLAARYPGKSSAELAALRPLYWPKVAAVFQTYDDTIGIEPFWGSHYFSGFVV